jgi:hypothetical protein
MSIAERNVYVKSEGAEQEDRKNKSSQNCDLYEKLIP